MVRMLHGLEKDNIGIITWLCDGADTVWSLLKGSATRWKHELWYMVSSAS